MYRKILQNIRREYNSEQVRSDCLNLYNIERQFQYSDFKRSAEFCHQRLLEAGIKNATITTLPADGKTTYLDCVMPEAWDAEAATLELINSDGSKELLTSLKDDIFCIANRCAPTPAAGLIVEVIDYNAMLHGTSVTGKYVFAHGIFPMFVREEAAKRGAIGLICDWTQNYDLQQYSWWCNGWCGPGWYHTAADRKMQCFMLSPAKAQRFVDIFAQGGKARVQAFVKSRIYDGEIYTVSGTIPGRTDKEIILLAHIYEPFITDDASGAFAVIEAARIINELIDAGTIPRPEKTIRFMLGMELYGFSEFFEKPENREKALYAINMDCLNFDVRKAGQSVYLRPSANAVPFWGDALLREITLEHLTDYPVRYEHNSISDDNFMSDHTIGVPSMWLYTRPQPHQHNAIDSFDNMVDWELGQRMTEIITTFTIMLCRENSTQMSKRFALDAIKELYDSATSNSALKIGFSTGTIERRITNFEEFFGLDSDSKLREKINHTKEELIAALPAPTPLITPKRELAANIIVERLTVGFPFSQAKVPVDKRICAGFLHPELLNWCDGTNSFHQAVENYELESGDTISDIELLKQLRFLRFLERFGYVKLHYTKTFTEDDIYQDLLKIGIKPGDRIMVHSTLSSLGPVNGGPETVCRALIRAVGESGAIMMPSFNFYNVAKHNSDRKKIYDPEITHTVTGAIPECFWKMPHVVRSLNPSHPVAVWGDKAEFYADGHQLTETMGLNSPLHKLEQDNGKVLLIDCSTANTFHHVVETTFGCRCTTDGPERLPVRMHDGEVKDFPCWIWRDNPCPHTDHGEYLSDMELAEKLTYGKIGFATSQLFNMRDCREILEKRFSGDNGCASCNVRPRHARDTDGEIND
jgi:aminoglycoside N3'-acetyltransferase/uncharacterized protein YjhX (UPF0386 family)